MLAHLEGADEEREDGGGGRERAGEELEWRAPPQVEVRERPPQPTHLTTGDVNMIKNATNPEHFEKMKEEEEEEEITGGTETASQSIFLF